MCHVAYYLICQCIVYIHIQFQWRSHVEPVRSLTATSSPLMITLWPEHTSCHKTLADPIGKPICGPVSGGRHVLPRPDGSREAVSGDQRDKPPASPTGGSECS